MTGPQNAMVSIILGKVARKKAMFEDGVIDYSQYRSEVKRLVTDAREMGLTRMVILRILGGEL